MKDGIGSPWNCTFGRGRYLLVTDGKRCSYKVGTLRYVCVYRVQLY